MSAHLPIGFRPHHFKCLHSDSPNNTITTSVIPQTVHSLILTHLTTIEIFLHTSSTQLYYHLQFMCHCTKENSNEVVNCFNQAHAENRISSKLQHLHLIKNTILENTNVPIFPNIPHDRCPNNIPQIS